MKYQGKHLPPEDRAKRAETSKRLLFCTGVIFGVSVTIGVVASFAGVDPTLFIAVIGVTGGVFGAAVVSYENKAKMENTVKIKMAIIKFRLAVGHYLTPEQMQQVETDIRVLEDAIDGKVDDTLTQAVAEDAEVKTF